LDLEFPPWREPTNPDDDELGIFPEEVSLDEILPRGTIRPLWGDDEDRSNKKPRL
jgi:hypothetical protein